LALGSWFLALGSWLLILGSWFLVLGSWLLVLGSWFLALGSNQSPFFIILLTRKSKNTEIIESKTTT
jgi:hypothetical protein